MSKANFIIKKGSFEQTVFFERAGKEVEVCRISQYSDCLEIYTAHKGNNASRPVLLEIDFLKNRDTELISHFVSGTIDTLLFKNFTGLGTLSVGKTPSKIKRLFTDERTSYLEAYSKCKSKDRTIYFSVRFMVEDTLDEFDNDVVEESFLIGAYLYDPKSINDEVYEPLQAIYAVKVKCSI